MKIINIIALVVILLFVASCTSTNTYEYKAAKNKRIGVFYELGFDAKLCQRHIGITVFNNFNKQYDLGVDLQAEIIKSLGEGIRASENQMVLLDQAPDLSPFMSFSSWNGKMSLNEKGAAIVRQYGEQHNLDYLIYSAKKASSEDKEAEPSSEKLSCEGILLGTGRYDQRYFGAVFGASIFDAKTGDALQFPMPSKAAFTSIRKQEKQPANVRKITDAEIAYYVKLNGIFIKTFFSEFIRVNDCRALRSQPICR